MANIGEVIEGLQLLSKYTGTSSFNIAAEHDEIYVHVDTEFVLTDEEKKRLKELHWHWHDSIDSWVCYV